MNLSKPIELEFNKSNALMLLSMGCNPEEPRYGHKQIAGWCERFWNKYCDVDAPDEIESIMPVLADVETQWDLYLANTYSVEELQSIALEDVCLPVAWFQQWFTEANA
ncbi:MAG: hypothetical protein V7739_06895 [Motiliproteus sp.]